MFIAEIVTHTKPLSVILALGENESNAESVAVSLGNGHDFLPRVHIMGIVTSLKHSSKYSLYNGNSNHNRLFGLCLMFDFKSMMELE